MKFSRWFYSAALLPLAVSSAELPAPATEVQIFRNSSAMIRHEVTPKGVSSFTVTGNFAPLEGTLWSSPNVKQIRKTLTEISRKEPIPFNDIISTWKNQRVTLRLACGNGKIEKISGTIIDLYKKETHDLWNQIVTLKCSNGNILAIRHNQIAGVESAALKVAERTVKETKQAWEFTLMPKAAGPVTFDYVSKVLNWTPAFKMTLLPEKKFTLTGSATVVNTGDELKNVKCVLWAGSPNIENLNHFSPMAMVKNAIPAPLQVRPLTVHYASKARAFMMNDAAAAAGEYVPSAPGISGNMAPFEIGSLTLKKGEALVRTLGKAAGSYENLVRWQIPARQADDGRRVWKISGTPTSNIWECLRFANPFKHPIPDAAVEIADGSRVLAQIKGSWVNTGESATWEITRCHDVKATFAEQEAPSSIKNRGVGVFQRLEKTSVKKTPRSANAKESTVAVKGGYINGIWYRVTDIKGRIQLKNFRKTPVKLVIEMDYFGEFVSASGKPEKKALNHFGSLNPKNQLLWNITLKPGESRKVDFRYNIIINR